MPAAAQTSATPTRATPASVAKSGPAAHTPGRLASADPSGRGGHSSSGHRPVAAPAEATPSPAGGKEPAGTATSLPSPVPPEPIASETPPAASSPARSATALTPRLPLAPFTFDPRRPRIAVHVVGEPLARIPAGYQGLGPVGQQSLISYLQQRLRLPAVASRLVGLTGGLSALDQSLRLGARHTLMVRLDSLVLAASPAVGPSGPQPFAGGTLSGRIHVVLLLDGKLLFDRSIMMPATLVLPQETPAQAYSRSLWATMDSVSGELAARLLQAAETTSAKSF